MLAGAVFVVRQGDAEVGADTIAWLSGTVFFIGLLGAWAGGIYDDYLVEYERVADFYRSQRNDDGQFGLLTALPYVSDGSGYHLVRGIFALGWLLFVLGLLFAAIYYFGALVRGAHYLFAPHPAEKVLRAAQEDNKASALYTEAMLKAVQVDADDLPPEYISRNHGRKAEALTKRVKAETELLRSVIEREKVRAKRDNLKES